MKTLRRLAAALAFSGALLLTLALSVSAQTAEEVAAKAIAARGGAGKLKSVNSEKVTGRITLGPDAEGPFTVIRANPARMHMEMTIQGQTVVRVYDGSAGWQINPFQFQGSSDPHELSGSDLKNIAEEADLEGPLRVEAVKTRRKSATGQTQRDFSQFFRFQAV